MTTTAPIARPKNAYDLLDALKPVFRDEPLRLNMSEVLRVGKETLERFMLKEPDCGTVGCIAGWAWAVTRKKGRTPKPYALGQIGTLQEVARIFAAADVYRVSAPGSAAHPCLDEFDADLHNLFYTFPDERKGTAKYAEVVIAAIEDFQAKWADRLQVTKVRVHA